MNKKCLICGNKTKIKRLKLKDGYICQSCMKKSGWGSWFFTQTGAFKWAGQHTFKQFEEFTRSGKTSKDAAQEYLKLRNLGIKTVPDSNISLEDAMAESEVDKINKMDTSDEVKRQLIAAKVFDLTFVKKEINYLPKVLDDTETIQYACSGVLDGHTWLVVCTNARLIFLNRNMIIGMDQKDIPLSVINAVTYTKQIVSGTISVTNGANVTAIEKINSVAAPIMAKTIREEMTKTKEPIQSHIIEQGPDVPDEIRKYKQLLDDKIITQEEFDAKKKELLNL